MRTRKNIPAPSIATAIAAAKFPIAGERFVTMQVKALARDLAAGRISVRDFRAQLRGEA